MSKIFLILIISSLFITVVSAETISGTVTVLTPNSIPAISHSGSSGGSGGGGVVLTEPLSNIANSDRQEKSLYYEKTTEYNFNSSVYRIDINSLTNEDFITVKVDELKSKSDKTTTPQGTVYKYLSIYVGTHRFKESTIYFTAPLGLNYVKLLHWNESSNSWDTLDTSPIDAIHYSAKTQGFSNFAIVGSPEVAIVPTIAPIIVTPTPTQTYPNTPIQTKTPIAIPGFEIIFGLFGITIIYLLRKGK